MGMHQVTWFLQTIIHPEQKAHFNADKLKNKNRQKKLFFSPFSIFIVKFLASCFILPTTARILSLVVLSDWLICDSDQKLPGTQKTSLPLYCTLHNLPKEMIIASSTKNSFNLFHNKCITHVIRKKCKIMWVSNTQRQHCTMYHCSSITLCIHLMSMCMYNQKQKWSIKFFTD